jgi:hypothetical protein
MVAGDMITFHVDNLQIKIVEEGEERNSTKLIEHF